MQEEKYRELAYQEYLSHFGKLHNIEDINREYKRTYLYLKGEIQPYLPDGNLSSLLDLGCGLGHAMFAFREMGCKKVLGVDISAECVDFCKRNGFHAEKRSILDYLRETDLDFQVIYACDIIEHFHKDEAIELLKLVKSKLQSNGRLLLILPNANNLSNLRLRYMDITHEVFYTPESILQLMHFAGFNNVKVLGLRHFSVNAASMRWSLVKRLIVSPVSKLSEFSQRLFYLSAGLPDVKFVAPRMLVIGMVE